MFAIIGIVVVFAAVIGGFLMEKGHILVLMQPAELLIIAGAAAGTLLVANPLRILKDIVAGLLGVAEGFAVYQSALPEHAEDDVPVPEQGAQRGAAGGGDGRGEAEGEHDLQELSGVSERPSRAGLCVRHAAHGDYRRRGAVRHGPDDGAGHGSASSMRRCSRPIR